MVNEKLSTKSRILEILRANSIPVSGDAIAKETGVSRVAVWKAIKTLENSGYKIDSARNGYVLTEDLADSLFPWEFGEGEGLFAYFKETDSTMIQGRIAAEECSKGELKVITADVQKNGHGHSDHKWTTTKGSLACTLVSKEAVPLAESYRFVMACQLSLAKTLQNLSNRKIFVRWPNDIWTENGKAGGILDDLSATGAWTNWINLGFGLNLSSKPKINGTDYIFSDRKKISRRDILKEIVHAFKTEVQAAKQADDSLQKQWNQFCPDIGKEFKAKNSGKVFVFKGINPYGMAITESKDNEGNGEEKLFPPCTINFIK